MRERKSMEFRCRWFEKQPTWCRFETSERWKISFTVTAVKWSFCCFCKYCDAFDSYCVRCINCDNRAEISMYVQSQTGNMYAGLVCSCSLKGDLHLPSYAFLLPPVVIPSVPYLIVCSSRSFGRWHISQSRQPMAIIPFHRFHQTNVIKHDVSLTYMCNAIAWRRNLFLACFSV